MKLKKSFQNLKRDIFDLREAIAKIREEIKNFEIIIPKKISNPNSGKIFTSKVFVNEEIKNAVNQVFDSGVFTMGEKVKEFERKFSEYCGIKHAIAVANGTVAIEVILKSLGVKEGDEIIVPSHTTMPTVEPILHLKAKPVFVDVSEDTYVLDVKEIEKLVTKKTKAIIAVHLYGNSADLEVLQSICNKRKIYLIEDCAQAHGTRYNGKHVGTFGIAGCFSFYPTKNLTVCGEGGMVITDNDEIAKKARMLISHGEEGRYNHVTLGTNYRLSEIHSAIGIKQLELLEKFVERRREIAKIYDNAFSGIKDIIIPKESKNSKHSFHLYVIRVDKLIRKKIIDELSKDNIFLGIHYPIPVHKQPIVKGLAKNSKLKITEKIVDEIISLPMYPLLKDEEALMIAEKIKLAVENEH